MLNIELFCLVCFLGGIYSFLWGVNHLLSMLLSLEFMVLMIFLMIMLQVGWGSQFIILIFLIFSVCEGVLGLTILVAMSRSFGGDYLNTFSLKI